MSEGAASSRRRDPKLLGVSKTQPRLRIPPLKRPRITTKPERDTATRIAAANMLAIATWLLLTRAITVRESRSVRRIVLRVTERCELREGGQ